LKKRKGEKRGHSNKNKKGKGFDSPPQRGKGKGNVHPSHFSFQGMRVPSSYHEIDGAGRKICQENGMREGGRENGPKREVKVTSSSTT